MTQFRTPKEVFLLLNSLAIGLSIIWDKNIVHRDLKPENIIIRPNGSPCIIDLGIARFLDLESLTKTISPMGPCTPIYAAIEQLTNKKNLIDPRTDFFSLGIIALELYLGFHPFDINNSGDNYLIVDNILQNNYVIKSKNLQVDEAIVQFADKTLQPQPYNRFRNSLMLNNFITKQI